MSLFSFLSKPEVLTPAFQKMYNLLSAAAWVEHEERLEGAASLVHVEYLSSDNTYLSEEGSEELTQRRTEAGAAKKGRAIYPRAWVTKKVSTIFYRHEHI